MQELKKYSPQFQHINDSLAFVVHLSFLSKECKLVGLNEEQYLEDIGSIPQGWNKSNEIYQFRYIQKTKKEKDKDKDKDKDEEKKNDDKNTILVKLISMGDNDLLISAVNQRANKPQTLEVKLTDYIDMKKASKDLNDYQSIYKDIDGLKILINDQVTNKVIPSQEKKKQEKNDNKNKKNDDNDNNNNNPLLIGQPHRPIPNINDPFGGGIGGGGIGPLGPFGGDIDPFAGGGGNLIGPNQINQQFRRPQQGGRGYVPGARFDPFGPGGHDPDPDHFKPPGGGRGRRGGGFGGGFGGGIGGGFGGF